MPWWDKIVREADLVCCVGKSQMERRRLSASRKLGADTGAARRAAKIATILKQYGPHKLAASLQDLGYDRLEYLNFLVLESRNEANPADLRFAMFERLDGICQAIAGVHPTVADHMNLVRAGSFKLGRKGKKGPLVPLEKSRGLEDVAEGKPAGSPFAAYLEKKGLVKTNG